MSESTAYEPVSASMATGAEKNATATASAAAPQKSGLWTRITNHVPFLRTKRGLAVSIIAILVIIGGGLAGLAALRNRSSDGSSGAGQGAPTSSSAISSDAHFFGQSPPVYPSRE